MSSVRTISNGFFALAGVCCFLSWSQSGCIVFTISPSRYGCSLYTRGLPITSTASPTLAFSGVSKLLMRMLPVPSSMTSSSFETITPYKRMRCTVCPSGKTTVLGASSCWVKRPLSSSDIHTGTAVGCCSTPSIFWAGMLFNLCGKV